MDNQTDPTHLANLPPDQLGTGIFLIPDVGNNEFGAMVKQFIPDVTYPDCVRRGYFAFAFKWVPNSVATLRQLRQSHCDGPCVDRCVGEGCVCNTARGQCQ